MTRTKKILAQIALCAIGINSWAADVQFDPNSRVAKILKISSINKVERVCTQTSYRGLITKIEGKYPSINIFVRTNRRTEEAFQLDLPDFDMVTLKSMNTLIDVGKVIHVKGQECGSGSFFYPLEISK